MSPGVVYALHFGGPKRYIGSTGRLNNRINGHWSLLAKGKHHSVALQRAVNKYGLDSLLIEILMDNVPLGNLLVEEQRFLDQHKGHTYNCSPTASSRRGCKERPETKAKRIASLMGNSYRKGIPHDDTSRTKISAGVKLAIAEGRRIYTGDAIRKFNAKVMAGEVPNPWRRSSAQIIEVLTHLAQTKSMPLTGKHLGMDQENVRSIVRQAVSILEEITGPSLRVKGRHGYFIHPDWFDYIREVA